MTLYCLDFIGGSVVPCPDGRQPADPLIRRTAGSSNSTAGARWKLVDGGGCATPGVAAAPGAPPVVVKVDLGPAVASAFQELPLAPSLLTVQPPSGWTLVNIDNFAFSDGAGQTLSANVLGTAVLIRATPVSYAWDFGDGSAPLVTSYPGAAYPHATIAHKYLAEGTHLIVLTTTWRADYRVAGSATWKPVSGTATTSSSSAPLTVYEARSRLVDGPVAY
jgi:hypothetical protein